MIITVTIELYGEYTKCDKRRFILKRLVYVCAFFMLRVKEKNFFVRLKTKNLQCFR